MFGDYVKRHRKERGLSQAELAKLLGISRPTLSDIENGKKTSINSKLATAIAHALKRPRNEVYVEAGLLDERFKEPSPRSIHELSWELSKIHEVPIIDNIQSNSIVGYLPIPPEAGQGSDLIAMKRWIGSVIAQAEDGRYLIINKERQPGAKDMVACLGNSPYPILIKGGKCEDHNCKFYGVVVGQFEWFIK